MGSKNKESKTGVTLYQLTEGIDNGPIIASKEFKLTSDITQSKLIKELKILANDLIVESIEMVKDKNNYKKAGAGTYFSFPDKDDVKEFKQNNKRFF